ncbi:MAG: glycosyltransferase family 2 protein [Spirochaetales bacterium]|nr:glycosyltransferase family 2 protein [Spirochaetales bacterium]
MNNSNLVSICIATYNRAHLLGAVIENVLSQTYSDFELLIVNDGSKDSTESVIKHYQNQDNRIAYFTHTTNKGLAAARNTAIRHARGLYFTFIDDDDAWNHDFLSYFVTAAATYDDRWCFCCGTDYTNNLGTHIHYIPDMNGPLKEYIKRGYTPPVGAQFYFLSTLKQIGGYTSEIKSGVDHDLWLKLAFHDINIYGVPKALVHPNIHADTSRITLSSRRRHKIQQALAIWETEISKHFGKRFFHHFKKSYYYGWQKNRIIGILKNRSLDQQTIVQLLLIFYRMAFKIEFLKELLFKLRLWLFCKKKKFITVKTPHSFPSFK